MRIIERYILKSALGLFFGCLFIFLFLYITIDIFSHLDEILKQKTSIIILLDYYLSYLPIILVQVTPIACLLSTLYTFAKLNRNNEIIAMRSCGLNIFQIARPILIFGAIVSLAIFWINDKFVPQALSYNQKIKQEMERGSTKKEPQQMILYNLSMYGSGNRLFFINKFTTNSNTMEGITILEHDEHQNIKRKIVANKGVYEDGGWVFYQSITYNFDENGQVIQEPIYMEKEIVSISEKPADFISQRQHPDLMNIAQLDDYIWKLSKSGANSIIRSLKVDLYQRFSFPATSFVIILIGIPFALMVKKRATGLSSLGISILVGFLYYALNAISIALGKGGVLPPIIAASASHLIAMIFSLSLIYRLP